MELLANQYRIENEAGSGSFGTVYCGYDLRMERKVAIKKVAAIGKNDSEILKRIDNKYLPRLYDIVYDPDYTYMIMEWIEGITLEKYINEHGAVSEKEAARIGTELLEVLQYLHNNTPSIIYQDLKPDNIMLKPDGHIKLIDFGTAIIMTYSDIKLQIAGTVGYASPEQNNECCADKRSDIFSWGAVMYTMLTGIMLNKPPYMIRSTREVCPHVSFGLAHIIDKAVKTDREKRYQSTTEVLNSMNKSYIIDFAIRLMHLFGIGICILPFAICWALGLREGTFGFIQQKIHTLYSFWQADVPNSFNEFKEFLSGIYPFFKIGISEVKLYEHIRVIGFIILSVCFMLAGIKKLSANKFWKSKRSVYLSEKKNPGLWMIALAAGILFGYGIGSDIEATRVYAADKQIEASYNTLPVSIVNNKNEQLIVDYDSEYFTDGDLVLVINKEQFNGKNGQKLDVMLEDFRTNEVRRRTMIIR